MSAPSRSPPTQAALGILFLIMATAFFAVLDTSVKYVGAFVPVLMAVWFRYMFQMTITAAVLLPRRGRGLFQTRHPWLQVLRGVSLVVSTSLAFLSLRYMPVGWEELLVRHYGAPQPELCQQRRTDGF